MIKSILFVIFLSASALIAAPMTAADRAMIWTRTWAEIRDHFTGFDKVPDVRWDDSLYVTMRSLQAEPGDVEFWRALRTRITALSDGGTQLSLPSDADRIYDLVPIRMIVAGDKILVKQLSESPDVIKSGIKVGDELLTVDGVPVWECLEKECIPHVSGSTHNGRMAEAVFRVLTGKRDTACRMSMKRPNGTTYEVTLKRDSGSTGQYYSSLFPSYGLVKKMAAKRVLYLCPNYFEYWGIEGEMLSEIRSRPKIDGLILDLRATRSGPVPLKLLSSLAMFPLPSGASREIVWKSTPTTNQFAMKGSFDFVRDWRDIPETMIQPADTVFRGKVIVLTSSETAGPAEQFIEPLVWAKRVTLVGDTTAGAGGDVMEVGFPQGGKLYITIRRPKWEEGRGDGKGFVPEVLTVPTPSGLAAGKDEVLDAAVKLLTDKKK